MTMVNGGTGTGSLNQVTLKHNLIKFVDDFILIFKMGKEKDKHYQVFLNFHLNLFLLIYKLVQSFLILHVCT